MQCSKIRIPYSAAPKTAFNLHTLWQATSRAATLDRPRVTATVHGHVAKNKRKYQTKSRASSSHVFMRVSIPHRKMLAHVPKIASRFDHRYDLERWMCVYPAGSNRRRRTVLSMVFPEKTAHAGRLVRRNYGEQARFSEHRGQSITLTWPTTLLVPRKPASIARSALEQLVFQLGRVDNRHLLSPGAHRIAARFESSNDNSSIRTVDRSIARKRSRRGELSKIVASE